jgi:hypothetical protein
MATRAPPASTINGATVFIACPVETAVADFEEVEEVDGVEVDELPILVNCPEVTPPEVVLLRLGLDRDSPPPPPTTGSLEVDREPPVVAPPPTPSGAVRTVMIPRSVDAQTQLVYISVSRRTSSTQTPDAAAVLQIMLDWARP